MNVKESERVVKEIEELYFKWLAFSGYASEKQFLDSCKFYCGFQVQIVPDENGVSVGFLNNGEFHPIGESILFEKGNREALLNVQLLLLYIGNKLDGVNKELAPFLRRKESCYDVVKELLLKTSLVF